MPRPQARLTRGLMNSPIQIRSEAAASLRIWIGEFISHLYDLAHRLRSG